MLKPVFALAALIACAALAGCAQNPSAGSQADSVDTGTVSGDITAPRNRARLHTELASGYYFKLGNLGVALEELRTAIAADPDYAPAYNLLGLVHMDLHEDDVAQRHFQHALSLAPNDPDINNNYGWFLCQTGRKQQSIEYFMAALKNPLYKTPARAYVNAGLCSLDKDDGRDSIGYFERALRNDPENPLALINLATLQFKHGQLEAARGYIVRYNRAVEPTAQSLWLALRIERKLGNRGAEDTLAAELRRRFLGSPEYQALVKGQYQ